MVAQVTFSAWIGLLVAQAMLAAAAPFVFKLIAERAVGHAFDRRLETHKAQLEAVNDQLRFDFERQLADIGHFASSRHKVMADIFHALRKADGAVRGLYGLRKEPTFAEFNEADLSKVMQDRGVAQGQQEHVIDLWRTDRKAGVKEMTHYLRMLEVIEARVALQDAYNLRLLNELFLTADVLKPLDEVFRLLEGILYDAENLPHPDVKRTDHSKVPPAIESVRVIMLAELGRGYSGPVRSAIKN